MKSIGVVQSLQSQTLEQHALILTATSQDYPIRIEMVKDQLRVNKLKTYIGEKRVQTKEYHGIRYWTVSRFVPNRCLEGEPLVDSNPGVYLELSRKL